MPLAINSKTSFVESFFLTSATKDTKDVEEETRTARARQVCCVDHRRNDLSRSHGDTEIKKDGSEEQKSDPFVFSEDGIKTMIATEAAEATERVRRNDTSSK